MAWLIAYSIGAALWLVLCGASIGEKITAATFVGAILLAAIWPLPFLVMIGAMIREFVRP